MSALVLALAFGVGGEQAFGDGVGTVMTAKSIPDATVALIDPESGTSSGGGAGSDVNLAVGDIILFQSALVPVPNAALNGMAGYLTEYIPDGTELVGARFINAAGETVIPNYPGLTRNGCHSNNTCNYSVLDGYGPLTDGSISQHIAETGIFFSTDARTSKNPSTAFITTNNGIEMTDLPLDIARVNSLLGDDSAPFFAHNAWDYLHVQQFGEAGGATHHGYGSPVAGPDTHYNLEVTTPDATTNFATNNPNEGPWQRIVYPGSTEGTGTGGDGAYGVLERAVIDADGVGWDLMPADAGVDSGTLANVTAVRFALGEIRTGVPIFAEIALRVTSTPFFDNSFVDPATGTGGNVDCAEVFGADLSAISAGGRGQNNVWALYMGSPACVFLRNKLDVKAETNRGLSGEIVNFDVTGTNLSNTADTNVNLCLKSNGLTFNSVEVGSLAAFSTDCAETDASGDPLCGDTTGMTCQVFDLGDLDPGEDYAIDINYELSGGNGTDAAPLQAVYTSDRIPAASGGFITQDVVVTTAVPVMEITMTPTWDPLTQFATYSSTNIEVDGTVTNVGTRRYGPSNLTLHLPQNWSVTDSDTSGTIDIIIDGDVKDCVADCATTSPQFPFDSNEDMDPSDASASLDFSFFLDIPADVDTGNGAGPELFTIDAAVDGSSQTFGANSESYFREVLTVNVGAVRSAAPVIDCASFGSTSQSIQGTADPDAAVDVKFNLINRLTATADGAAAAVPGAWDANTVAEYEAFGGMYGGLEVSATATVAGELESELSNRCLAEGRRECSDGIDNDGDGVADFPGDLGCESPTDNDETDPVPECSDGIDNDADGNSDTDDTDCTDADDPTEGPATCSDGVDNDSDGLTDFPNDLGCSSADDEDEVDLVECNDGVDNADPEDTDADFAAGLGDRDCLSSFDTTETFEPESGEIKTRLLLLMDTSGSMNSNTCNDTFTGGDGSTECPGDDVLLATCDDGDVGVNPGETSNDGLPNDSRLAKVKTGMNNVIAGFGEVEFGLMRFAQRPEEFVCPSSFGGQRSGGWQGGGAAPCEGVAAPGLPFNGGEMLVGFGAENQEELLAWMDGDSNYNGTDPELVPAGQDHELRGSGTTPIAGALDTAQGVLDNERAIDADGGCRPYVVILVTDGDETCGGDPTAEATELAAAGYDVYVIGFATEDPTTVASLNSIANAGTVAGPARDAIFVDNSDALSQAIADIIAETALVEVCDGIDNDCDGVEDEGFQLFCDVDGGEPSAVLCDDPGDPCGGGDNNCFDGTNDEITNACGLCGPVPTEACNGDDDDCDGFIDEGFTLPCECVPTGPEVCNGIDDDCDGDIDNADTDDMPFVGDACSGICEDGIFDCNPAGELQCLTDLLVNGGQPLPDPELEESLDTCDGDDNDCDNVVDEVSVSCYDPNDNGLADDVGCNVGTGDCDGLCQLGVQACLPAGAGAGECVGDVGPAQDVCDGQDNDCDGIIDNGFPVGDVCDNGQLGECLVVGEIVCDPADPLDVICTAFPVTPGVEVCNGLDDDCDGEVDENTVDEPLPAPVGNSCGGTGTACDAGTIVCVDGALECDGVVGGTDETCNGLDDDCDSLIDEDTPAEPLLGVGDQCYAFATGCDLGAGTCQGSCDFGATICVGGSIVCDGSVGPAVEETCNGEDDDCDGEVDEAAECPSAEDVCFEGSCVSPCGAGEFPCPLDFFCQTVPDEGDFCTPDPCVDLECEDFELCDSDLGACFDPCDDNDCPAGFECLLGNCFDCFDAGFECAENENCLLSDTTTAGECVPDPCFGVQCADTQFCREGACVDITCDPACADGERCEEGVCVDDLCDNVECGAQICDPNTGDCVTDLCENKFCPQGTACNPSDGECISDPCLETNCPDPLVCEVDFNGTGQCVEVVIEEPEGDWVAPGGGGGCSTTGSTSSGAGSLLLFGLVGIAIRRRRRTRP